MRALLHGRAVAGFPLRRGILACAPRASQLSVTRQPPSLLHDARFGWSRAFASTAAPGSDDAKETASTTSEGAEGAANLDAETADSEAASAEDPVAELEKRVAELQEQLDSKHDQVLRALAEADNARRRATIDVENAHKFSVGKFAKDLLDVADNLARAAEAVPEESRANDGEPTLKALYEGVVMVEGILVKTFEQHGLVKQWPMDEKFDPNLHNALFEMQDPEREPGTIGHVAKAGYTLHERCIRPADVGIVSKPQ
jgi:molecular chaperone GrpE